MLRCHADIDRHRVGVVPGAPGKDIGQHRFVCQVGVVHVDLQAHDASCCGFAVDFPDAALNVPFALGPSVGDFPEVFVRVDAVARPGAFLELDIQCATVEAVNVDVPDSGQFG